MLTKKQVLQICRSDLEQSKKIKENINRKITDWIDIWNGVSEEKIADGRSKFVVKEVEKQGRTFIANAVSPFFSAKELVRLTPITSSDVEQAELMTQILNYQMLRASAGKIFIRDSLETIAKEGTAIAKVGWTTRSIKDKVIQIDQLTGEQKEIEVEKIVEDRPTVELLKNEDVLVDPTANDIETARFVIHKFRSTISELRMQDKKYNPDGIYTNVDYIKLPSKQVPDNSLQSSREYSSRLQGNDDDFQSEDRSRAIVDVYEYWGELDINDDGISENVVVTFVENMIIRLEENPMPNQVKPFFASWFIKDPFDFWGNALADTIGTHQKVVTAFSRMFVENFAYSNNSMYVTAKGALDPINRRLLDKAKPNTIIEVNPIGGLPPQSAITQLQPLQIPSQAFNVFELFKGEAEMQTGISKNMQGAMLGNYSTAMESQITAGYGEKRLIEIVTRFIETYIKPITKLWVELNKRYLSNEEVIRITEANEFNGWNIDSEYDVDIAVAVSGLEATKTQQISMLIQSLAPLVQTGQAPQDMVKKLVVKQCELWGFQDMAKELESYEPQPDPLAQRKQIIEVVRAELENKAIEADIESKKNKADVATTKAITSYERQQADINLKKQKLQLEQHNSLHKNSIDMLDKTVGKGVK